MHGSKQLLRGNLGGLLFYKRNGMFLFMLLKMQTRSWLETQFAHPSFSEKDKTVVMFHDIKTIGPHPKKIKKHSVFWIPFVQVLWSKEKNTWCTALNRISIAFPLRLKKRRGRTTRNGRGRVDHRLLDKGWLHTQHLTASVTATAQDPPTNITSPLIPAFRKHLVDL